MSNLITPSVTFSPGGAGAGTLDFSPYAAFDIRALVGVHNNNTNTPIYARGASGFGYASLSGSVVTLQASTSGMSSGDALSIKFDDLNAPLAKDASIQALVALIANNALKVATQSNAPPLEATGTLAANNDAVTLAIPGQQTAIFDLPTSGWSGTVIAEGIALSGGSNWLTLNVIPYAGGAAVSAITSGGTYEVSISGLAQIRLRASGAITGTLPVLVRGATGNKSMRIGAPTANPVPVTVAPLGFTDRSGTTSATPGTFTTIAAANASRQYFRYTNTSNAVQYLWDKTGTPSIAGSIPIPVGSGYVFDAKVSSAAIQVASSTASTTFEAAEG